MDWKPTYDNFRDKTSAANDAARRTRQAKENGSGRVYAVKKKGNIFTVMYQDRGKKA